MTKHRDKKKTFLERRAEMIKQGTSEPICKSQVNDALYTKLAEGHKIADFVACIKYCSSKQMTMEQTCETLSNVFKFYAPDGVGVEQFKSMLSIYYSIADAWNYGTCGTFIDLQKAKDKASEVIEKLPTSGGEKYNPHNSMKAIQLYRELYDIEYAESQNNKGVGSLNVSIELGKDDGEGYE